jgi:diketogulonate reductase-like aldo/keto reductase
MEICGSSIQLSNGVQIPTIGYGTYQLDNVEKQVCEAINCGYRHVDTATAYGNEEMVGFALKRIIVDEGSVRRGDLFVTSKVANGDQGYYSTLRAFEATINKLQLDYLDLYLIHWPVPRGKEDCYKNLNHETWRAFEELYAVGKVKAIGVSNFLIRHLEQLKEETVISPMVNQIEFHPQFQQKELVSYCKTNHILVEGWGPFRHGKIFEISVLHEIARNYQVSVAQLCIKWCLQKGIAPIFKATSRKRLLENQNVFNFKIHESDMSIIEGLNTNTCFEDFWSYKRQQKY